MRHMFTKWLNLTHRQKLGIGAGVYLFLVILVGIIFPSNKKDDGYRALYANLDAEEAQQIVNRLKEMNQDFRWTESDSLFFVSETSLAHLRMSLSIEGYPKTGMIVYESFNNIPLKLTDFQADGKFPQGLENELRQTCQELDNVADMRLHIIDIQASEIFSDQQPRLVFLAQLKIATDIENREIAGIHHLIIKSVQDLTPENLRVTNLKDAQPSTIDQLMQLMPGRFDTLQVNALIVEQSTIFSFTSSELGEIYDVRPLYSAPNGDLWWGLNGGVVHYNGNIWTKHTFRDGLMAGKIESIVEGNDGTIWCVGYHQDTTAVSRYDGQIWQTYTDCPTTDRIGRICAVDTKNNLWLTSDKDVSNSFSRKWEGQGVLSFDGTTWQQFQTEDGLVHNQVNDITAESNGSIWFATENGVSQLQQGQWKTHRKNQHTDRIMISQDGEIWCAYSDSFSIFSDNTWRHITKPMRLSNFSLIEMKQKNDGALLLGPDWDTFQQKSSVAKERDELIGSIFENVTAMKIENRIHTEIASGWMHYNNNAWLPISLKGISSTDSLQALTVTANGSFWMLVSHVGLVYYQPNYQSLSTISGTVFKPNGMPYDNLEIRVTDEQNHTQAVSRTQNDGQYSIQVFPGTYQASLVYAHGGYAKNVTVGPGETIRGIDLQTRIATKAFSRHLMLASLAIIMCTFFLIKKRRRLLDLALNPPKIFRELAHQSNFTIPFLFATLSTLTISLLLFHNASSDAILEHNPINLNSWSTLFLSLLRHTLWSMASLLLFWGIRFAAIWVLGWLFKEQMPFSNLLSITGYTYMFEWVGSMIAAMLYLFGINAVDVSAQIMRETPFNLMMWRPTSLGHIFFAQEVHQSLFSAVLWQIELFGFWSLALMAIALNQAYDIKWCKILAIIGIYWTLMVSVIYGYTSIGNLIPFLIIAAIIGLFILISRQQRQLKEAQLQLISEMEQELETAREMQMRLLPTEQSKIPGFDIAGRCIPASHVGGDYFHYFDHDDRLRIALADVTGHAMEAAIPVVMFSGVLESQTELGGNVTDLFGRLNRSLHSTLDRRTFICFVMGELNPNTNTFYLSNGGCPYPYHFQAETDQVSELQMDAYPLGIRPDTQYDSISGQLCSGDRLVFCSDGIIEVKNPHGEQLGYERTSEVIREACEGDCSAETTVDRILDTIDTFKASAEQDDDMTCVVVRIL